jgi:hypothetical protein
MPANTDVEAWLAAVAPSAVDAWAGGRAEK